MTAKVVQLWRDQPDVVRPLRNLDFLNGDWLDQLLEGSLQPQPSSVAFLTNLIVAKDPSFSSAHAAAWLPRRSTASSG